MRKSRAIDAAISGYWCVSKASMAVPEHKPAVNKMKNGSSFFGNTETSWKAKTATITSIIAGSTRETYQAEVLCPLLRCTRKSERVNSHGWSLDEGKALPLGTDGRGVLFPMGRESCGTCLPTCSTRDSVRLQLAASVANGRMRKRSLPNRRV